MIFFAFGKIGQAYIISSVLRGVFFSNKRQFWPNKASGLGSFILVSSGNFNPKLITRARVIQNNLDFHNL